MRALISTIVAVSLVGCATRADEIEAAYVSPLQYESFTCKQIGLEIGRVSTRVHEVTGQQEDTADKDAVVMGVGLILFWPALFFLAGGDHEEELARLKGEYDACQRRSKISPPGRSKTSPLNVMRYAVLGGCPGSP